MRRWIFKGAILLLVVATFLAGLIALGQWSLKQIRGHDRYLVSFSDIDCTPPAGLERIAFLDEVQYLANLPESLSLLDEELPKRLADGFRRHPWVAKVITVELEPPKQVHVELAYRRPVLAVKVGDTVRAVDEQGILLPNDAITEGLPVFPGEAARPAGPAGSRWGDAGVEAMAKKLGK